ncbi:MAG: hypothetical protein Q9227_002102 [Pyrenula ochraceoflavens]
MPRRAAIKARQAANSTVSTPTPLTTFSDPILSTACSQVITSANSTSVTTQTTTATSGTTIATTVPSTTLATTVYQTTTAGQVITSGVVTNSSSTVTVTTTSTSTTTITIASGAPSATPQYLQISPDPNTNANWALSDPATHLTDNYYFPNRREVFELTSSGMLYSVTNNSYYGIPTGSTANKLYWSTNVAYANTTFYGTALNDGTGRTQLFLNNTAANAPFNFCISNSTSGDGNTATGLHVNYFVTSGQIAAYCKACSLFLSPVTNG